MNKKQKRKLKKIIISLVLLVIITVVVIISDIESKMSVVPKRIIMTLLYLIPYLIIGWDVLKKAFKNIKNGQVFDENFLMMVATIGAFCLAEYKEAAAVMLFYQVGELFENIAVNKSRTAITSLVNLRPDYANLEKDGNYEKVDPYDVNIDDVIVVLPGEKVPLDGVVIDGESFVNTAALTGESVPRKIGTGEEILSGCINEQGKLRVKVSRLFDDSTVAKILDMVENASSKKSKSESFITRFAKYYTPIVVYFAIFVAIVPPIILSQSFVVWVSKALIFLVISCPCALVISVPLGFFGGIGAASKHGILVKGSNYLEEIAYVDTVVFDKTGTLTQGVFKVNEVKSTSNMSEASLLEVAAYAEANSNHPIAKSIMVCYQENNGTIDSARVEEVSEIAGKGISIIYREEGASKRYYVGNNKLLKDKKINVPNVDAHGTIVYVAGDDKCFGYIVISDLIKDSSVKAISRLHDLGISKTVMLTGDRDATATAVAKEVGIDKVYSELLPADKLSTLEMIISEKKSNKSLVAFVGDGINDAPSLTRADVGIAMGAMGQDAAIEAADIVLMDDNPDKIATARLIGKRTISIVKQNIVFALGVKLLAMILGLFGMVGLWFAVFADVGVSVIAILNSTRMLRYREK